MLNAVGGVPLTIAYAIPSGGRMAQVAVLHRRPHGTGVRIGQVAGLHNGLRDAKVLSCPEHDKKTTTKKTTKNDKKN